MIRSPRAAMRLMEWSYRIAGIEIGAWMGRKPYSKATVIRWCHRRGSRWYLPLDAEKLNAWGHALNDWVTRQVPELRFQMRVNSPWKCWLEEQDARGKWRKVDLRRAKR